jgi:2-polyprenyl-6-methoxyphenol hydroxylase-like FAD-dependent oxidoreductase
LPRWRGAGAPRVAYAGHCKRCLRDRDLQVERCGAHDESCEPVLSDESRMKVTIAGGSIGGLCAGIALRGIDADVQIFERESGPMDIRGAGIVVQPHLTSLLREHHAPEPPVTSCQIRRYLDPVGGEGQTQLAPQNFTSWEAIYLTLRATFPEDRYHMSAEIITPEAARVIAAVEGREPVESDILIAADGANSPLRRRFLPHVAPRYAGYVAWRGTLDEADAPPRLVSFLDDAFTFCEARSGGAHTGLFHPRRRSGR